MPTADPKSKTQDGVSSSEESVSSKAAPDPHKTETGNTAATRPSQKPEHQPAAGEHYPSVGKDRSRGPDDHVEASGRDHPSTSEHAAGQSQKLHGTSDKRVNGGGAKGG
jgi:hypothetical protein